MAKMAKTIDGFTQHQTRLAVVIDGLDSCEQDKVLQMLDTVRPSHLHRRRSSHLSHDEKNVLFYAFNQKH